MSLLLCTLAALAPAPQDTQPATRPRPFQPMQVPRTVARARGDRRIAIDGDLADWPSAPPVLLDDPRQVSGSQLGAWRNASDCSAQAFLAWDADNLYFAAVVRDDWHRPLAKDSARLTEVPPADSIVLTFDPRRDTRALGADAGRAEDREFWLAECEGENGVVLWDRYRGVARFVQDGIVVVAQDPRERMTTYEARIPWRDVLPPGERPEQKRVLNVQVVVNDYDDIVDLIPQTRLGWTFGTGPRIDPALMGQVMLVGDVAEGELTLPEFPPPPQRTDAPVPPMAFWLDLRARLRAHPPAIVAGTDPGAAGGATRQELLRTLDQQCEAFPRVDHLEYHFRIHRRMVRETEGIAQSGLPAYWQLRLADLERDASGPPPERGFRLFRLPMGGWLVRSQWANFAIDPAGHEIEKRLWGAIDFALLTAPLDVTKRNDQLLIRLAAAKRTTLVHIAIPLPGVDSTKIELAEIGKTYDAGKLKVTVLGHVAENKAVTATVGYRIAFPDGATLLHAGQTRMAERKADEAPADVLILSARHYEPAATARRVAPRLVVLDDVLQCATAAGAAGRVRYGEALELQRTLQPLASLVLAGGEAVDSTR
jgi:hypothetical protein